MAQTESEQETLAPRKNVDEVIEAARTTLAERMQDAVRLALQDTQANFEALAARHKGDCRARKTPGQEQRPETKADMRNGTRRR